MSEDWTDDQWAAALAGPDLQPGDVYVYTTHDGGILLSRREDRDGEFVTLADALAQVQAAHDDGHEVFVAGDRGPLSIAALEQIGALWVQPTPFEAAAPPRFWTDGTTTLMFAAIAGRADLVEDLIARGAHVSAPDGEGWTALDHAEAHHPELAGRLVAAGATRRDLQPPRSAGKGRARTHDLASKWQTGILYVPPLVCLILLGMCVMMSVLNDSWPVGLGAVIVGLALCAFLFPWAALRVFARPISLTGSNLTVRDFFGRTKVLDLSQASLGLLAVVHPNGPAQDTWLFVAHPEGRALDSFTLWLMNANRADRKRLRDKGGRVVAIAVSRWRIDTVPPPIAAALRRVGKRYVTRWRS